MTLINYPKLTWLRRQHHERFARRVNAGKLICQVCRGNGEYVDDAIEYGYGPFVECGWCEGTRKVTPWLRGQWLRLKRGNCKAT